MNAPKFSVVTGTGDAKVMTMLYKALWAAKKNACASSLEEPGIVFSVEENGKIINSYKNGEVYNGDEEWLRKPHRQSRCRQRRGRNEPRTQSLPRSLG